MEPHPLWEYPAYPLSDVHEVFNLDFEPCTTLTNKIIRKTTISLTNPGVLNGVALWHEIEFEKDLKLNTGILEEPVVGKKVVWSKFHKQAVHILDKEINSNQQMKVECTINFNPMQGEFKIDFKTF
jgi:hypothetical protein